MISIQCVKSVVCCIRTCNTYGSKWSSHKTDVQDRLETLAHAVVCGVHEGNYGFASEVAATVLKYNRASEKQAYVIARAAVENNISALYCPFTGEEEPWFCEQESY